MEETGLTDINSTSLLRKLTYMNNDAYVDCLLANILNPLNNIYINHVVAAWLNYSHFFHS